MGDNEPTLTWEQVRQLPRVTVATLTVRSIPAVPGVYIWWHSGAVVYVGEAKTSLRRRLSDHLDASVDVSRSTLRRSVALAQLGIPRAASKHRPSVVTRADAAVVSGWLRTCELTWVQCRTGAEAHALEQWLRGAWLPPLNRV